MIACATNRISSSCSLNCRAAIEFVINHVQLDLKQSTAFAMPGILLPTGKNIRIVRSPYFTWLERDRARLPYLVPNCEVCVAIDSARYCSAIDHCDRKCQIDGALRNRAAPVRLLEWQTFYRSRLSIKSLIESGWLEETYGLNSVIATVKDFSSLCR